MTSAALLSTHAIPDNGSSSNGDAPSPRSRHPKHDPAAATLLMHRLPERLRTFAAWPVPFLDPGALASDGFYYLGADDLVRCAYCGIEIGCWERGDAPRSEHLRWNPHCPLLTNRETSRIGVDDCGFKMNENNVPSKDGSLSILLNNLGIETNITTAHPTYALFDKRLSTFEHWPVSIKQKPHDLALAGFYYTGYGDQTVCFHCGLGLKAWQEDDDPWEQHALWSEKCVFLRLQKGAEFIDQIKSRHAEDSTAGEDRILEEIDPEAREVCASLNVDLITAASKPQAQSQDHRTKESNNTNNGGGGVGGGNNPLCGICYANERSIVNLPCRHMIACVDCAATATTCPVCRQEVRACVKAFMA